MPTRVKGLHCWTREAGKSAIKRWTGYAFNRTHTVQHDTTLYNTDLIETIQYCHSMSAAIIRGPEWHVIRCHLSPIHLAKCEFLANSIGCLHSYVNIEYFKRPPTRITESLSIKGDNLDKDLDDTRLVCDSWRRSTAKWTRCDSNMIIRVAKSSSDLDRYTDKFGTRPSFESDRLSGGNKHKVRLRSTRKRLIKRRTRAVTRINRSNDEKHANHSTGISSARPAQTTGQISGNSHISLGGRLGFQSDASE
jgi:hypothetical protein